MNKKIIWFIAFILLLLPIVSFAKGLVPCGGTGGERPCTSCDFLTLIQRIITFGLKLTFIVAIVLIIIAGFNVMFSGGDSGKVAKAWGGVKNVIIGLAIILVAWVVVNTLLYYFAPGLPRLQRTWYKLECAPGSTLTPAEGGGGNLVPGDEGGDGSGGGGGFN